MQGLRIYTMSNPIREKVTLAASRNLFLSLLGIAALVTAGCSTSERDENDGVVISNIVLDPDVVLGLFCEDVGVFPENCVLDDPANPFAGTFIPEFDPNREGPSKFDLADELPAGPDGAKSRFYFWATALARRGSGENQYYTALALHELFTANSNALQEDELIREQALKAYRSVLDNFFGSAVVFECRECAKIPRLDDDGEPVLDEFGNVEMVFPQFAVPLNERVADHLFRTLSTSTPVYPNGLRRLVPTEIEVKDLFVEWGYAYQECTDLPDCTNGVISIAEF